MPKWTQDEAIAFESARECITDMMGICSEAIAEEETRPVHDAGRLADLEAELASLATERSSLSVGDHQRIATVRAEYGACVRIYRASQKHQAA